MQTDAQAAPTKQPTAKENYKAQKEQMNYDQKLAEQQMKNNHQLQLKQDKFETDAQTEHNRQVIRGENQNQFSKDNKEGLSFSQKMTSNRIRNKEDNRASKLINAGVDPETRKPLQPTMLPNGQAVFPNGKVVGTPMVNGVPGVAGGGGVNIVTGTGSGGGSDNFMKDMFKYQMIGQAVGVGTGAINQGIDYGFSQIPNNNNNGGQSNNSQPSGVPEPAPNPAPSDPSQQPNQSPSHMVPGNTNINYTNITGNSIWSGLPSGSNSSSNNTQGGAGTTTADPNKKPLPSNSNAQTAPSVTGPNFSGWLG